MVSRKDTIAAPSLRNATQEDVNRIIEESGYHPTHRRFTFCRVKMHTMLLIGVAGRCKYG